MSKIKYEGADATMRSLMRKHSNAFALNKKEIGKTPIA